MDIEIEKDIPIPRKRRITGITETMRIMEIGDSFVYPSHRLSSVTGTATAVRKERPEFRITTRKINDAEVRVWRVS